MMKQKKTIATVLCAALLSSVIATTGFAAEPKQVAATGAMGSIKATLRFDYPQLLSKVKEKNINITLYKDGTAMGEIQLTGEITGELRDKTRVTQKNVDGVAITTEEEIGYLDVDINELPLGKYHFAFEGDGYTPYKTPAIALEDYSQQIILGTGDKTFSIGDVNGDKKVNHTDRELVSNALGKTDEQSLSRYDLNGDG